MPSEWRSLSRLPVSTIWLRIFQPDSKPCFSSSLSSWARIGVFGQTGEDEDSETIVCTFGLFSFGLLCKRKESVRARVNHSSQEFVNRNPRSVREYSENSSPGTSESH